MRTFKNTEERKREKKGRKKKDKNGRVKYPQRCQFECVGHTDYHNVAAYCTLHYISTIKCDQ